MPTRAARVKELTDVVGIRENLLFGYGLVVGLAGTGDTDRVAFTAQSIVGMLGRLGIRVDPKQIQVRNVAAVMVTARLPPFARPGTRIDAAVSSLGNARSLAGGILLVTPLTGGDGRVYAVGQGPVQVAGFETSASGAGVSKNTPTSGRVANGATVERSVDFSLGTGPVTLSLRRPDLTDAARIAAAVNAKLGPGTARALDPAAVELTVPEARKADEVTFLAEVELLEVQVDQRARVVVSERTGVVVAGEGVRLRPVAVAHGGLSVRVQRDPVISQPETRSKGQTVTASKDSVDAAEATGSAIALRATATVEDLARALNLLGASPRDLVAVLEAIKAAGALEGDLEVLE
ncbi:MAG TPA: flagellar basal body P-ring protein FlgI [Anaeromyxobacter sp.]|nr:flagellar basal body P-ring protein FlgI [Anaeromyxobacter sp.]